MKIGPYPAPSTTARRVIAAPAGDMEILLAAPAIPPVGSMVVCHPHPLKGGTLDNKVVYTLANCATKSGYMALRFNFRGAGKSEGVHDHGRAESDDVAWLAQQLREELPGRLVLAGFSFGAFVSLSAAQRVRPDGLISIAPPFGKYFDDAPLPPAPGCPWLVLHSQDDEVVSYRETADILRRYKPPPNLVTLDGAGHFFHARLADIQTAALPFLATL